MILAALVKLVLVSPDHTYFSFLQSLLSSPSTDWLKKRKLYLHLFELLFASSLRKDVSPHRQGGKEYLKATVLVSCLLVTPVYKLIILQFAFVHMPKDSGLFISNGITCRENIFVHIGM